MNAITRRHRHIVRFLRPLTTQRIFMTTFNRNRSIDHFHLFSENMFENISRRFYQFTHSLGADVEIEGPSFAESISEGDIRWIKQKGDFVKTDEIVAEIETDKTAVEVPAPFSGRITELLVEDGSKVTAKQKLYKLEKVEGESDGVKSEQKESRTDVPSDDKIIAVDKLNEIPKTTEVKSPLISNITTKPISSIPTAEIRDTISKHKPESEVKQPVIGARTETRVKMNRMRQRIAERLKEAQNTTAMLTTFNEVDLLNVLELRKKYQEAFIKKHGVKLSLMSPFVKASSIALKDQPVVNAVIENGEIIYREYIDISIAVAAPKGLVVPVIRNVDSMNYPEIEKSISALGAKARDGKLAIEDMEGGTFTISNGGVFGSMFGTPIINPPQSAILGMHAIFDRPTAINGKVEIRPMMYVALTYDHRLIDGREAVTFLKKIKQNVEDPVAILLDL